MIIQFNMIRDDRERQYGSKMFYHWNDGTIPSDDQVVNLLAEYYLLELRLRERKRMRDPMIIETDYGMGIAEVFPIFCNYDKNKCVVDLPVHVEFDARGWYIPPPREFRDLFN